MRITDEQLLQYISLYESEYGVKLEKSRALTQLHKLIQLVLFIAFPDKTVSDIEKEITKGYNKGAVHEEVLIEDDRL